MSINKNDIIILYFILIQQWLKTCTFINCLKQSINGYNSCENHGGGKRCPNCKDWIDSRIGCKKV